MVSQLPLYFASHTHVPLDHGHSQKILDCSPLPSPYRRRAFFAVLSVGQRILYSRGALSLFFQARRLRHPFLFSNGRFINSLGLPNRKREKKKKKTGGKSKGGKWKSLGGRAHAASTREGRGGKGREGKKRVCRSSGTRRRRLYCPSHRRQLL